jgi:hypothetical protein
MLRAFHANMLDTTGAEAIATTLKQSALQPVPLSQAIVFPK